MSSKKLTGTDKLKSQLQAKHAGRRKHNQENVAVASALHGPKRNDLQPNMKTCRRPVVALKASPNRTRETTPRLLESTVRSIEKFGIVLPVLIDSQNIIVAGHALWEAAALLGLKEIECRVVEHLKAAELEALSLALNRIGEIGKYNLVKLRERMISIESQGIELLSTGFSLPEITQIKLPPNINEVTEEDASSGEQDCPVSISGDLFLLGKHRLLCGDARDSASYMALMNGELAHASFGDGPYNCKIAGFVGGLGKHQHEDFLMFSGKESDAEFVTFIETYLKHSSAVMVEGGVIFACTDWRQIDLVLAAGHNAGLKRINVHVWNKGSGGMGGVYRSAHELIPMFCKGETPRVNNVALGTHGRDRTNVWTFPGANRQGSSAALALADHPTPKPVELVLEAVIDITNPGEVILDPFIGSGTTIIACEQCDRIAYGMELDPKYVDRTIRRWERLTAVPAIHEETGMTFAELHAHRSAENEGGQNG